jgi:hypothetical protein
MASTSFQNIKRSRLMIEQAVLLNVLLSERRRIDPRTRGDRDKGAVPWIMQLGSVSFKLVGRFNLASEE